MNNELKILKYFLENRENVFTINQISKNLKINYRIAYQTIKQLEKEELIKINKVGNSNLCTLTNYFNYKIFTAEIMRRTILLKNKNLKIMHKHFEKINQQFIMLIFGSHIKQTSHNQSDIDLLLISNNDKKIMEEIELLPLPIHLTSITYKDFINMLKSKEMTVVSEAIKNNIILFGTEDYYRLIQNAN